MENKWYSQKPADVLQAFQSNKEGLTQEESESRLKKYGLNKLPEERTDSLLIIFLRQFQSPLIYILLFSSFIVFAMREFIDGSIILFTLFFNAVVGTIQEGKAQNTLLALKKFMETNARVRRNGEEAIIPDYEVVPGDIILLQEGDKVPADARVILSSNLTVDEAALTGESIPVHKFTETLVALNLPTAEQKNMVFKGTHIVAGNGEAVVVATGLETVLGQISKEVAAIETEIPLKANIRYLSCLILAVVATISTSLFFFGVILGRSVREMFTTVVSLSVSIIPEGLPVVMTLVLATGVWRMTKRNALVKKLQAVEALGQARVVAVDKTGTLTKNEILLQRAYIEGKMFQVGGEGYKPEGEIILEGQRINPKNSPELLFLGKIAAFASNNNVVFSNESQEWEAVGDPTDAALSIFAQKTGFSKDVLEKEFPRLSEVPFDSKNQYHAVVHEVDQKPLLAVVGAPEVILDFSSKIWAGGKEKTLSGKMKKELEAVLEKMSQEGLRVLAAAVKENVSDSPPNKISGLAFVGFLGLKDALRPEIAAAVKEAVSAGVKVVMITGDHQMTARAIAREAGIYHEGDTVLTGEDMEAISDQELADMLGSVSVFARVTPAHKLRIVMAYKKRGEIVAMTGDGVNDAPSLVAADLGISMGKIGTEVAKEASDIILLDDNFKSIISAIEEGRSIYKTIKKVILYLFSTSFGEVLTIAGALFLGWPLPLLAAQIVWLNLVTDGFLDVALAMEPKEEGLLESSFERPKKYLLDRLSILRMFFMAVPMMIGTLLLFNNYYQADLVKAWTVSLTVLAVFQWFNALNCRHESKSILSLNPFSNKFLIGAILIVILLQVTAIYHPLMQQILHTTPLELSDWLVIVPTAFSIVVVEEGRKFFQKHLHL